MSDRKLLDLHREKVLNSLKDDTFDDAISLAGLICSTPNLILSFAHSTRSWHYTPSKKFTLRNDTANLFQELLRFCDSKTRVVSDLEFDPDFYSHPFIANDKSIRFYACFLLKTSKNEIVGMLHFYDQDPKTFTPEQIQGIELLTKMMGERLEKETAIYMDRKSTEDAFHKQTEFLDAVLENLGDGIVACNDQAQLTVFNRATRIFHGLDSRGDIPSEQWSEYYSLLHADGKTPMQMSDIPLFRAFNGEVLRDAEMVIDSIDGGRRNIVSSGRSIFRSDGSKLGAVVTLHDITDIKKANAKADTTTKLLQGLIDVCPIGIAVFDVDENIVMWNPGNEKIFGWKLEEVLNKPMPYVDESHSRQVKAIYENVRSTKKKFEGQKERYRKDGTKVDIHISVLPLLNENDELQGFMTVTIDVSDVKQREANLVASNRALEAAAVAKSEFLANMSHEIRTPLNAVIGMTDLVLMSVLTVEQQDLLKTSQTAAMNLLSIVSDILDFTKMEAGNIHVENINFDLNQVIDEVYESSKLNAETKGLKLVKAFASGGPKNPNFFGDPERIRQVLNNLISNAIKFTNKGEIQTTISFAKLDNKKTTVRFEVKDTGIGIPAEVMPRLFQPFSQADSSTTKRFGGTGLGLSLSKGLIDLMKGQLGAESTVGNGSKFWFTLQLENVVQENEAGIKSLKTPSEYRILMAEDNSMNQKIALAMLTKLGYHADVVEHGRAAVEALKTNTYDLILMDCQMPEMDGYEATHIIRTDNTLPNDIAIIAVTANAMKGDREKCIAAGMSDYISKPVKVDILKEMLERYLSHGGGLAKSS